MEVMNKFITIKRHIEGAPQESDFELKRLNQFLSAIGGSNDVIVKTIYLSMDPYQLNRMKSYSSSQKAHSSAVGIIPGDVSHTKHTNLFVLVYNGKGDMGASVSQDSNLCANLMEYLVYWNETVME
ncbi:2-alkenal reductase (NADP(+)-dependent) [Camellia lanceoleosa]|uniref:2-alkenal reductase (NADP(+)-dependent) n=1 Tax=Camellia lanceoleosa TaxID=1840588 RepID=A0ACC0FKB6_9ERIC|nr:2-alkenal reductase (NADP(+)-dependent) [Camellia lanceoleosa]